MATRTGGKKLTPVGTMVLEQLAGLDVETLSLDAAHRLVQFQFSPEHQERFSLLARKASEGLLTPGEQDELDKYIRVGDLVAFFQSRARRAPEKAASTS